MTTQTERTDAINWVLRIMRLGGLWPLSTSREEPPVLAFLKVNYRYALHVPITFTFIGLMWLEAFVSNNLEQAGQVLYMSLTEIALVVKILNIWYRSTAARRIMGHMKHSSDYALQSEQEHSYWQQQQRLFKWYFYLFLLASLGVVYSSCIGVLFLHDYELPFDYFVPFEYRNERRYYYAYGYSLIGMTVTSVSNVCLDALGCYFLFHLSLLYRLLGYRVRGLQYTASEVEFKEKLVIVFKLHNRIRNLTVQIETLVSPYVLSQIVLSAFIICFSGYRLQHVGIRANPGQFVSMLQFLSVMVLEIFLPCYFGNEVTVYAHQLTNDVYNTNWLQCDKRSRQLLIAYMEHLKKPTKIRAGYFFEVGLPIFVKVDIRYAVFTILYS
ncbi:hypothetical protein AWZ03_003830 [Drosophila navojoa]|uniref:Odorant receptor n=1 Tax=Drosophila navojoa TaxID=7232 RepID=A0A484BNR4_DRONA|nr:hypothetical protein AWZ03_003830 [Drosophila navojoa]